MLKRIGDKLEDPKRPLLGPNVKSWKVLGLLLPKNKPLKFFYLFTRFAIAVFVITGYVEVWFVKDNVKVLLRNVETNLPATIAFFKIISVLIRQKDWRSIIDYVSKANLNQRDTKDKQNLSKIQYFTRYSRKLTYINWGLMYTAVTICIAMPILKYVLLKDYREGVKNGTVAYTELLSAWVPFDKNTMKGYVANSLFQSFIAVNAGGMSAAYDAMAMVIMVFFRSELELLRMDAAKIFEQKDKEKVKRRIKDCHRRHTELIKFFRLFNSCISPILMLYLLVCGFVICVTVYKLGIEPGVMEKIQTLQLLVLDIAQLFMYCWHSNQILYASLHLKLGPYESDWYDDDIKYRKDLCILTSQFQKTVVVSAGPFTDLTLPTFISILKAAYSYYTILSNAQIK